MAPIAVTYFFAGATLPALAAGPSGAWKTDWARFFILLAAPFVVMAIYAWLKTAGRLSPRCPECHGELKIEEKTKSEPTSDKPGIGIRIRTCPACGYHDEKEFAIAQYLQAGSVRSWADKDRVEWLRAKIREQRGFGAGPQPPKDRPR